MNTDKLSERIRKYPEGNADLYGFVDSISTNQMLKWADEIAIIESRLSEADRYIEAMNKTMHFPNGINYPSGICSAHQIADPTCGTCNPVIGRLLHELAEARAALAKVTA